jgi:peptide/nickel transport system permease protein
VLLACSTFCRFAVDGVALLVAAVGCVLLGVLATFVPRAAVIVTNIIRPISMAVPPIVLGTALILIFAIRLNLLPAFGDQAEVPSAVEGLRHLILPALTLGLGALAITLRQICSDMFAVSRRNAS